MAEWLKRGIANPNCAGSIPARPSMDKEKKKHRGQNGPDCFACKIQTIGFDREKIRAVPKK